MSEITELEYQEPSLNLKKIRNHGDPYDSDSSQSSEE